MKTSGWEHKLRPIRKYLYAGLVLASFIPDIGIKFSTVGFTWTFYRTVVALCASSTLLLHGRIVIEKGTLLAKWIIFQLLWMIYGWIMLFIGKYADFHNGFIELLSIFNGLVVFYCMSRFLKKEENKAWIIKFTYWILNFLIVFGMIEIVSGKHWITSGYYDVNSSLYNYNNRHLATGFMYNMNDFSALITCMTPVLLLKRFGKKRLLSLLGVFIINLRNDATTCSFAIILFILYYFLIIKGGKTQKATVFRVAFWIVVLTMLALVLYYREQLTGRSDVLGAAARQIRNAKMGMGSLYHRLIMYKDAINALVLSGMLGLGPSGFPKYFTIHKSMSGLVNPHAMIIEVLTQYGIIIAGWYAFLLVKMFRTAKSKVSINSSDENGLVVIAFVIVYFVASFAPSSFIGYSYQWILIAIMCSLLENNTIIGGVDLCSILHS